MERLPTQVDPRSAEFAANAEANRAGVAALRAAREVARAGGGARSLERHQAQGKLLVRDRLARLLDPGSPFLELSPLAAYAVYQDDAPGAGMVSLEQVTHYPFAGDIRIVVKPEKPATFSILLRIPSWAHEASIQVNGVDWQHAVVPGTYAAVTRHWQRDDVINLLLPMSPAMHWKARRSVQESSGPDGSPIEQEVMHSDYLAITRGPLVYATSLIDGFKMQETIRLAEGDRSRLLEVIDSPPGCEGPAIRLNLGYRAPLIFHPYYEAGGRKDGTWRLTWMQVAAESAINSSNG